MDVKLADSWVTRRRCVRRTNETGRGRPTRKEMGTPWRVRRGQSREERNESCRVSEDAIATAGGGGGERTKHW